MNSRHTQYLISLSLLVMGGSFAYAPINKSPKILSPTITISPTKETYSTPEPVCYNPQGRLIPCRYPDLVTQQVEMDIQENEVSRMMFIVPQEVNVDQEIEIKLYIDSKDSLELISTKTAQFDGGATIPSDNLQIVPSDRIRARLTATKPDIFTILSLQENDEQLAVDPPNLTEWRWQLVANKAGKTTLNLVIERLVMYGQEERWYEVDSRSVTIVAKMPFEYYVKKSLEEVNLIEIFIGIITAIIVGIAIPQILAKFKRKPQRAKTKPARDKDKNEK